MNLSSFFCILRSNYFGPITSSWFFLDYYKGLFFNNQPLGLNSGPSTQYLLFLGLFNVLPLKPRRETMYVLRRSNLSRLLINATVSL